MMVTGELIISTVMLLLFAWATGPEIASLIRKEKKKLPSVQRDNEYWNALIQLDKEFTADEDLRRPPVQKTLTAAKQEAPRECMAWVYGLRHEKKDCIFCPKEVKVLPGCPPAADHEEIVASKKAVPVLCSITGCDGCRTGEMFDNKEIRRRGVFPLER